MGTQKNCLNGKVLEHLYKHLLNLMDKIFFYIFTLKNYFILAFVYMLQDFS